MTPILIIYSIIFSKLNIISLIISIIPSLYVIISFLRYKHLFQGNTIRIFYRREMTALLGLIKYPLIIVNCSNTPLIIKVKSLKINKRNVSIRVRHKTILIYPKHKFQLLLQLRTKYQGNYLIKKIKFRIYSPNLLFYIDKVFELKATIRVFPKTYFIITRILAGRGLGPGETISELKITRRGWEYFSSREYQPGDELKFIDWKATARLQKIMIKQFLQETSGSLALIFDISNTKLSDKGLDELAQIIVLLLNSCFRNKIPITLILWYGEDYEILLKDSTNFSEITKALKLILELFVKRKRGRMDTESIPLSYYNTVSSYLEQKGFKVLQLIYNRVRREIVKADAIINFLKGNFIVIVSDLAFPIERLIYILMYSNPYKVIVIVPYPFWYEIANPKAREIAREYFYKKVELLRKNDIIVHSSSVSKIVKEITRLIT